MTFDQLQQLNNAVLSPFVMINGFFIKVQKNSTQKI